MVEMGLSAVGFEIGKGDQAGEGVVGLRVRQFGGRLGQAHVAFERAVRIVYIEDIADTYRSIER